jgi:hypothetical protein
MAKRWYLVLVLVAFVAGRRGMEADADGVVVWVAEAARAGTRALSLDSPK